MANKFKYKSSSDNKVTVPFSSIGVDGSGQGSIGTREIISSNHVRITDVNSNTRQSHLIQGLSGDQEYTVSVEYLKITGTPTFRFQIQGYIGGSYVRTIKFTNTEETGLRDIDGWQTATWTFTLAGNENGVRIWWQDGADYTTYTHSFELKNPDLRISDSNSIFKGNWAIDTSAPNSGGGPSSTTGLYNGAPIPNGGYAIYSPGSVYTATTDDDLLGKVRDLGGDYGSINAALTWIAGQPDIISLNKAFDNLVTDGLVLNLDASNISSFVDNKPTTNLLAAYNDGFVRSVTWTNDGTWIWNHNASDNHKPEIQGIDTSDIRLMSGRSITTGSQHFGCSQVGVTSGETYTVSVWFFQNRSGTSHPYIRTSVNNNSLGYLTYNEVSNGSWPVNQWIRISATATVQANETGIYISNYIGSQVDDQVWYCAPQVELGTEMTAFAKGTRLQNTTLYDLSNNDIHGTLINTPSFNSNGSIDFDGINDSLQIPHPPTNMTDGMSIELLIKSGATNNAFVICPLSHGIDAYIRMNSSSRIYMGVIPAPDSSVQTLWTQSSLSADRFHRVTFTYKQSIGGTAYFDGTLEDSQVSLYTALDWDDVWNIGQRGNDTYFADMHLAEMKVYDKALSQSEILQNYYKSPIVTDGLVFAVDAGNLVSYESGDTTTNSLTGSSTGTLTNGVGFSSANGGVWEFDGVDDYIDIPFNSSLDVDYLTAEVWIKSDFITGPSTRHYIMNGCSHRWGVIVDEANTLRWYINTTSGASELTWVDSLVSQNDWMCIACTFDGSSSKIYVNGAEKSSVSHSGTISTANSSGRLMDYRGNGYETEGLATNFKIYNRGLTADEVAQNYNAQRNRFGI